MSISYAQYPVISGGGGGGISSINGISTSSQTFGTGTSGTDFAIVSSGSSHIFNLPDASATARGVITSGIQTIGGNKTFMGVILENINGIGPVSYTEGLGVFSSTSATSSTPQTSPAITYTVQAWNNSASVPVKFYTIGRSALYNAQVNAFWGVYPSIDGASPSGTSSFSVNAQGKVGVGTDLAQYQFHVIKQDGTFLPTALFQDLKSDGYTMLSLANPGGAQFNFGVGAASESTFGVANKFFVYDQTNNLMRWVLTQTGQTGFGGVTSPTAFVHLSAGTSTAGTGPLKFSAGTNTSTPEAGLMEYDGTNYFVSNTGVRYTLAKTITVTATLDFPSTAGGASSDLTVTITGASVGDVVALGVPNGSVVAHSCYSAWVSATDTVTVRFNNYDSTNSADPASGTFRVSVFKY